MPESTEKGSRGIAIPTASEMHSNKTIEERAESARREDSKKGKAVRSPAEEAIAGLFEGKTIKEPKTEIVKKILEEAKSRVAKEPEEDEDRTFQEIQKELIKLRDKPNKKVENELIALKKNLTDTAKIAGVFTSINSRASEIQTSGKFRFKEAREEIRNINTHSLEAEARGVGAVRYGGKTYENIDWNPEFQGMIEAYKENILRNMELALMKVEGRKKTKEYRGLVRENNLLGWGDPPTNLERLARDHIASSDKGGDRAEGIDLEKLLKSFTPEKFAEALGVSSPEAQLQMYRGAEGYMAPLEIAVGNEPKFWPHLTEAERDEWQARATLSVACATKAAAPSFDKLFPNEAAAFNLNKEAVKSLFSKKGVLEALSLYTVFIRHEDFMKKDSKKKERDIGEYLMADTDDAERKWCPKSIFDATDEKKINAFKKAMRHWLKDNLGLDEVEAQDAEQISWNFVYISGMVEHFDSKVFRGKEAKRLPPTTRLKSVQSWMMQHPYERLLAKVKNDDEWSIFGPWLMNRKKNLGGGKDDIEKWQPKESDRLPETLFPNSFDYTEIGKTKKGKLKDKSLLGIKEFVNIDGGVFLSDLLIENGKRLVKDPKSDLVQIPFDNLNDAPFSNYFVNQISPAILVFSVISYGEDRDRDVPALGNAARKLGLSKRHKEILLMAWEGINSNTNDLRSAEGNFGWGRYKRELKRYAPNYFKD